ncbi:MAG TPA: extracellular solute-binding protein [Ktedonobacterales bacterium]|nr:extracellular solute-binding protein [Ktedonobacterales bacterium]
MRLPFAPIRLTPRTRGASARFSFGTVLVALLALAACGGQGASAAPKGTVSVAYAGSLVNLMEHKLGPAFQSATGYTYQGKGAGSTALANQIKGKLIQPDVFISASAGAYKPLMGGANGNIVSWYLSFAATQMVIGYSPHSHLASQLQAAASGSTPWYSVLETSGLRLGRTDPRLDPKGINTLYTMKLAEIYYSQPGLSAKILGTPENTSQIFPEEDLVARLGSGQLDAGFFYLNEVKDAGLPYITLPAQINLGDPSQASYYAQATYTNAKGETATGKPVLYSLTIPSTVKNEAGAVAFVQYLLGSGGQGFLTADGIMPITVKFTGDASKVPAGLSQYAKG